MNTLEALTLARTALELIAAPTRPDGTYNRSREACEQLARETLAKIDGAAQPAPAATLSGGALDAPYVVYSDGACKGNPGPASFGVVVTQNGRTIRERKEYLGHQTNQIAELTGAIAALDATPEGATVELVSDSQYVLKGLTEWRAGWERKGFITASGTPVANRAYWKKLYELADARKVSVRWVRGHSGDPLNERCDQLANEAIAENK